MHLPLPFDCLLSHLCNLKFNCEFSPLEHRWCWLIAQCTKTLQTPVRRTKGMTIVHLSAWHLQLALWISPDANAFCKCRVKIHNFVSLYDMVPRLLGRFVPETVRPHLFYVNPEVSHAALNFTPFGHFHLLSQNQMLSTMMDSRGGYADNHALQMSQQYQEALGPLIAQHSLEGVLLLSHAMGGYITEVKGVLSSDVSCGSKQASRLYQATLCHTGRSQVLVASV